MGGNVDTIAKEAFKELDANSVVCRTGIKNLSDGAFRGSNIQSFFADGIITISQPSIFKECSNLSSISSPSLTTISGSFLFYNCVNLRSLSFPALTIISGGTLFYNCVNLRSISFPSFTTISGSGVFGEVDSLALANMRLDLDKAYVNFFKNPKHFNRPKFKLRKHRKDAYRTNNQRGSIAIVDGKYIKLPKIGLIKAKIHRQPKEGWILKSATVSMNRADEYYVSVLFEYEDICSYVPDMDNAIGLDYASDGLYVDDKGHVGSNHKYYRESQKKLGKAQKRLSRMVGSGGGEPKSNNYLKQLKKVNKIHRHIANQRLDNLHKLSTEISNQYDIVCVESLNMRVMANHAFKNGKATMDNGYGMFLTMLEYKLNDRNKYFVKVDKWFPSSQQCSVCGAIHSEMKDLSKRIMTCQCGNIISRDQNAAINIKKEGLRLLGKNLVAQRPSIVG